MFLIISLIISLGNLEAKELSYRFGEKAYHVTYDQEKLSLKTIDIYLTIKATKCFQSNYFSLYKNLDSLFQGSVIQKNSAAKGIYLTYKSKEYKIPADSIIGQRILEIPRGFIQYKLMEKKQCGSSNAK
jgi:hypothetical protein